MPETNQMSMEEALKFFAQRVPVLEEQLRVANHRLSNLEKAHTPAGRAIS